MIQQEDSQNKKELTLYQRQQILTYPKYLQTKLSEIVRNTGHSVEEIGRQLEEWETIL